MTKPVVALVGCPNVGKSTMFNRIIGKRIAIVEDFAGTTRDRIYGEADWIGYDFMVIDTGGMEIYSHSRSYQFGDTGHKVGIESGLFLSEVREQANIAIAEAHVIVFIVDAQIGVSSGDMAVANVLRRSNKPVILAVNKVDNKATQDNVNDFYEIGMGAPHAISALQGRGMGDLLDAVIDVLPKYESETNEEDDRLKIAIVGRPNVGKSSYLNKILGYERAIVSDVPGTTRDAIDSMIDFEGEEIVLIDTAGLRRRGKIGRGVEKYSSFRTAKAIRRADVCILMIDANEMVTAQDQHIAGYILDEYKSVIVVVNKWDLIQKDTYTINAYTKKIRQELKFLDYVPLIFVSALTGKRVRNVLNLALEVQKERLRRISTGEINRLMREAVSQNPPKGTHRHALRFYYITQVSVDPPTYVFFVNNHNLVHFSYQRYLENQLRAKYPFIGTPLKLIFRNRKEKKVRS
ncbi:MAG: ribosome biogenesis GTPase Der [Anaerolineaceae bacterium 4572_78]|nr:MAG: ribosome biogenesis GTPase Der [Anaerolineaceae bacterium 4572_78]